MTNPSHENAPTMYHVVDRYIRTGLPLWLHACGMKQIADQLRTLAPLRTEDDLRHASLIVKQARSDLRARRRRAQAAARHASWNAWPAWDAAWNAGRTAGWEPAHQLSRSEDDTTARNLLLSGGHAARAAAWKIAWDAAVDDADGSPADAAWNAVHEPLDACTTAMTQQ